MLFGSAGSSFPLWKIQEREDLTYFPAWKTRPATRPLLFIMRYSGLIMRLPFLILIYLIMHIARVLILFHNACCSISAAFSLYRWLSSQRGVQSLWLSISARYRNRLWKPNLPDVIQPTQVDWCTSWADLGKREGLVPSGVDGDTSTRAQAAPLGLLASSAYRSTAAIRGSSNATILL